MRTPMHTTFDHLPTRSPDFVAYAARAVSWPTRLLRAPFEALNRRRKEARLQAELAALDDRLLADIGLRRVPADRWDALNGPCG
jgi:uncharacterized protein YjiS (DUF1127 family)